MLKRSLQLIALSLFLNFCLLVTISVPTLAQGPLPTPSPTPSANSSLTADDASPAGSEAPTTGRGILNVRPPENVPENVDPPTPVPAPQGGFGTAAQAFGRAKTQERFAPTRNPRIAFPIWGKHLNWILNGFAQGAGLGLGLQLTSADSIPGVEFRFTALTSTKLYRLFEGEAYIPRIFSEKTHADIWFQYLRRTKDTFFGIGPRIPNTSQTNYDIETRSFYGLLQHDFEEHLSAGVFVGVEDTSTYPGERDQDIPFNGLFSGDPILAIKNFGSLTAWAPGFQQNTKILTWGGFGEFDRRNNDHGLTRGFFVYGRIASHDGLDLDNAFSDYGWVEGAIDVRGYIPIFSDRTSIALRSGTVLQKTKGGSQIPFYDLAYLGGREFVRGFKNYRWRGNNAQLFSGEFRQTVYAIKEDRGIDVVVFADTGQVWGDNRDQIVPSLPPAVVPRIVIIPAIIANQSFDSSNWRSSFGGGLQYRHSKGLAARIELGHSNERNLIYFSLSRGF